MTLVHLRRGMMAINMVVAVTDGPSVAVRLAGQANGALGAQEICARMAGYCRADTESRNDFEIGCRNLTQPFFFFYFDERGWLPVPRAFFELTAESTMIYK